MTGDGGDELFAGYERFYAAQLFQRMSQAPKPLWRALSSLLGALPEGSAYDDKVKRARRFANAASMSIADGYFDLARVFSADLIGQLCASDGTDTADFSRYLDASDDPVTGLLNANMRSYLPDDLLIKADRCSMAASLEARAPFLDHELVEQAATIPFNLKLKGAHSKGHPQKNGARHLAGRDHRSPKTWIWHPAGRLAAAGHDAGARYPAQPAGAGARTVATRRGRAFD